MGKNRMDRFTPKQEVPYTPPLLVSRGGGGYDEIVYGEPRETDAEAWLRFKESMMAKAAEMRERAERAREYYERKNAEESAALRRAEWAMRVEIIQHGPSRDDPFNVRRTVRIEVDGVHHHTLFDLTGNPEDDRYLLMAARDKVLDMAEANWGDKKDPPLGDDQKRGLIALLKAKPVSKEVVDLSMLANVKLTNSLGMGTPRTGLNLAGLVLYLDHDFERERTCPVLLAGLTAMSIAGRVVDSGWFVEKFVRTGLHPFAGTKSELHEFVRAETMFRHWCAALSLTAKHWPAATWLEEGLASAQGGPASKRREILGALFRRAGKELGPDWHGVLSHLYCVATRFEVEWEVPKFAAHVRAMAIHLRTLFEQLGEEKAKPLLAGLYSAVLVPAALYGQSKGFENVELTNEAARRLMQRASGELMEDDDADEE